jgi:hypothetical protein
MIIPSASGETSAEPASAGGEDLEAPGAETDAEKPTADAIALAKKPAPGDEAGEKPPVDERSAVGGASAPVEEPAGGDEPTEAAVAEDEPAEAAVPADEPKGGTAVASVPANASPQSIASPDRPATTTKGSTYSSVFVVGGGVVVALLLLFGLTFYVLRPQ